MIFFFLDFVKKNVSNTEAQTRLTAEEYITGQNDYKTLSGGREQRRPMLIFIR